MKVMLINAPPLKSTGITGQIYPPLGILYLASYVRQARADIEFRAIDGYNEKPKAVPGAVGAFGPDVVGISFTSQAATGAYKLIRELKQQDPDVFVVIGGPHPTALPEDCFRDGPKADLAVIGEGEQTFLEILEALEGGGDLKSIAGTAYWADGQLHRNEARDLIADLDTIPFPARDLLDIRRYPGYMYKKRRADTNIISARGCPFDCVYCSNPVWKLRKPWYRLRSPRNVVDEIEMIAEQYGITEIFDETDEFNGSKRWAAEVCREIIDRKVDVALKAQMRVDNIDADLVAKLEQAGLWMALFGLESANDRTLKGINKRQSLEQMNRAMSLMAGSGIKCFGLFMAFNVWEEDGQVAFEGRHESMNTLNYVRQLVRERKLQLFGWSMTTPYPGSKLYDIALRHNLIDKRHVGHWERFDSGASFTMALPGVSEKDWVAVMSAGKRLQMRLLLTSGTFKYLRKAWGLLKTRLGRLRK